jgi:hypothetical protein
MAAVTATLWFPRPSWRACLAAGLLLGASSLVRPTGLPLLAAFVVYVVVAHWRAWRALVVGVVACGAAFAVPVLGYEAWYSSAHGEFAMTDSTGVFLYSRVMTFADCSRMSLPTDLLPLCTAVPPDKRPVAQAYIWTTASPLDRYAAPMFSPAVNKLAERFAVAAIEAQPADYARAVWDDTVRSFEWNRSVFPNGQTYDAYLFGPQPLAVPAGSPYGGYSSVEAYYARGNPQTAVVNPFAAVIRDYQRYVWLPGTVYGLILLVGLFGVVRRWRRAGKAAPTGGYGGASPRAILLPWLCSLVLVVAPAATAEFDYRYVTTAVPFACLAAAMAFGSASLARRGAGRGPDGRLADPRHHERNLAADAT